MSKRLILTAAIPALALAACSAEPDEQAATTGDATEDVATAQVDAATGAGADDQPASSSLASADTLAADYHGVWDHVDGSCDPMSDMRLEITADRLQFYESTGDITAIERESNGDRLVTVAMSGEGETWDATFRLEMDSTGQFLVVTATEDDFEGVPRKRCS